MIETHERRIAWVGKTARPGIAHLDVLEVRREHLQPFSRQKLSCRPCRRRAARAPRSCPSPLVPATSGPPGRRTRADLEERLLDVGHVVEHPGRDDTVEALVGEGRDPGRRRSCIDPAGRGQLDHPRREVESHDAARRARSSIRCGELTRAAADLEHASPAAHRRPPRTRRPGRSGPRRASGRRRCASKAAPRSRTPSVTTSGSSSLTGSTIGCPGNPLRRRACRRARRSRSRRRRRTRPRGCGRPRSGPGRRRAGARTRGSGRSTASSDRSRGRT